MFDNPHRIKPGLTIQDLAEVLVESERQYKKILLQLQGENRELRGQVQNLSDRCDNLEKQVRRLQQEANDLPSAY